MGVGIKIHLKQETKMERKFIMQNKTLQTFIVLSLIVSVDFISGNRANAESPCDSGWNIITSSNRNYPTQAAAVAACNEKDTNGSFKEYLHPGLNYSCVGFESAPGNSWGWVFCSNNPS